MVYLERTAIRVRGAPEAIHGLAVERRDNIV